jgi:hypothetical protein
MLGTLAIIDGNFMSQIAAGAFNNLWYAVIWGLMCYSGVGCWSVLTFHSAPIGVKLVAISLTRMIAFVMSIILIPAGLLIGRLTIQANYIAAAVVFTVAVLMISGSLGLKVRSLKIGKVEVPPPLLTMVISTAMFLRSEATSIEKIAVDITSTDAIASILGVVVGILAAALSEVVASLIGQLAERSLSPWTLKAVRFYGGVLLACLGCSLSGFVRFEFDLILILYLSGIVGIGLSVAVRKSLLLRRD